MRAKILTLRFSPNLGRFDDAPLVALQQRVVLEHVREHIVQVGGESMLVCVTTWREKTDGSSPPNATAPTVAAATSEPIAAVTERTGPATPVGELCADFTAEQQVLFDLLRRWRKQKAYDEGAPPYVVLTNRQLVELVRQRPHSKTAMGQIDGFGDKKLARHGAELLALLWPEAPPAEPREAVAVAAATAEVAS